MIRLIFGIMLCLFWIFACDGNHNDNSKESDNEYLPLSCNDNTCYDPNSDLKWQRVPAESYMSWPEAKDYCEFLDLDGDKNWRLPTINELRTLIRGCSETEIGGQCNIMTEDCLEQACEDEDISCGGCSGNEGNANGCYWPDNMEGKCGSYYSSTALLSNEYNIYSVDYYVASVSGYGRHYSNDSLVRCVAFESKPDADDELSGNTWQDGDTSLLLTWQYPPPLHEFSWSEARDYCDSLSLDGASAWRLPTIDELRSLIRGCPLTETGGNCRVKDKDCLQSSCWDDYCYGCDMLGGPADGCYWPAELSEICSGYTASTYWSSTPIDGNQNRVWVINFSIALINHDEKAGVNRHHVWCIGVP